MLKILQARLKQYMNWELPHVQAGFRKGRGTRDQIANICWIIRRQRNSKKTHPSASLTMLTPLTVNHNKLWKILRKRWAFQTTLPVTWETCMWVKKQQLKPYVEQLTGSKLGKEYDKAVYCHPVYLTSVQSTSCEILGWRITSWNQDSWEKHQQHQICRRYHSKGQKAKRN